MKQTPLRAIGCFARSIAVNTIIINEQLQGFIYARTKFCLVYSTKQDTVIVTIPVCLLDANNQFDAENRGTHQLR